MWRAESGRAYEAIGSPSLTSCILALGFLGGAGGPPRLRSRRAPPATVTVASSVAVNKAAAKAYSEAALRLITSIFGTTLVLTYGALSADADKAD